MYILMKRDGDLRSIFRQHLPQAQWTAIETGVISGGVPDSEYCFPDGKQGWLEFKNVQGWRAVLRPGQVSWISRRARLGGVVFVAARRGDELYLVHGKLVERLHEDGLQGAPWARKFVGGPARWNWARIEDTLRGALPS
jgi:hypothetical protein